MMKDYKDLIMEDIKAALQHKGWCTTYPVVHSPTTEQHIEAESIAVHLRSIFRQLCREARQSDAIGRESNLIADMSRFNTNRCTVKKRGAETEW